MGESELSEEPQIILEEESQVGPARRRSLRF